MKTIIFFLSRLILRGASGAPGRLNKQQSHADEIRAVVRLKVNETLYIVVGQVGHSFCEINGVSEAMTLSYIYVRPAVRSRKN